MNTDESRFQQKNLGRTLCALALGAVLHATPVRGQELSVVESHMRFVHQIDSRIEQVDDYLSAWPESPKRARLLSTIEKLRQDAKVLPKDIEEDSAVTRYVKRLYELQDVEVRGMRMLEEDGNVDIYSYTDTGTNDMFVVGAVYSPEPLKPKTIVIQRYKRAYPREVCVYDNGDLGFIIYAQDELKAVVGAYKDIEDISFSKESCDAVAEMIIPLLTASYSYAASIDDDIQSLVPELQEGR